MSVKTKTFSNKIINYGIFSIHLFSQFNSRIKYFIILTGIQKFYEVLTVNFFCADV